MADAQPDVAMNAVPDAQPRHGAMSSPTPSLVDQGVAWLIEHEPDKIWKQFPDHLAVAVEQAHIFTHKKYIHTHTRKKAYQNWLTNKTENALSYAWQGTEYQIHFDLKIQVNMKTDRKRRVIRAE